MALSESVTLNARVPVIKGKSSARDTEAVIKQLFFCKFRELVLSCCARAVSQGFIVR
jgi:hypothetical protein